MRDSQTYDQVQCSPHHGNTPLHPFTRHIEHAADIGRAESDELKLEKLEGLLPAGLWHAANGGGEVEPPH